jgi:hypothetical protein
MILRAPDALTVDNAEEYVVSIRLEPGGLSFAGYMPAEKGSLFCTKMTFDPAKSYMQALKDAFFEHPFFSYSYKQVYVVCVNRQYTLAPEAAFVEEQKEQLISFVFSSPAPKILHDTVAPLEAKILYCMPVEAYEFCSRSLIRPQFIHAITPLLIRWKKQNSACFPKQLCVAVHDRMMDVACYDKGALIFLNSFDPEDTTDILYYILYAWKQIGIDQLEDRLLLSVDPSIYPALNETLQRYVRHVELMASSFTDGQEYENVPLDILSLLTCES